MFYNGGESREENAADRFGDDAAVSGLYRCRIEPFDKRTIRREERD